MQPANVLFRLWVAAATVGAGSFAIAQSSDSQAEAEPSDETSDAVALELLVPTAQKSIEDMESKLEAAAKLLKEASDENDATQLLCVTEKVNIMKGILKVSSDANVAMQDALNASDAQRARYEFRKIAASRLRMGELLQGAMNCAGAEASESNTSVEMQIDESLALTDPYYGNTDFFFDSSETLKDPNRIALGGDDPAPDVRPPPASEVLN